MEMKQHLLEKVYVLFSLLSLIFLFVAYTQDKIVDTPERKFNFLSKNPLVVVLIDNSTSTYKITEGKNYV
jgi:hypothetical protein